MDGKLRGVKKGIISRRNMNINQHIFSILYFLRVHDIIAFGKCEQKDIHECTIPPLPNKLIKPYKKK